MKTRTSVLMVGPLVVCSALLVGCSSVSKPAEADGSTRVAANDPSRVSALQQRQMADRQLQSDNGLLRAQVDVLQSKLMEMTQIVRDALTLPPTPRPQPSMSPQSMGVPSLPSTAYAATNDGAVIRVFYPFARTEFEPGEQVARALRAGIRDAEFIEVRGYTDGNAPNVADRRIAMQRADGARLWLLSNGVDPSKVHTRYFTAGNFLVENATSAGRSLNRRVEIDVHSQALLGGRMASTAR